jgi:glycogen debranching enzyme
MLNLDQSKEWLETNGIGGFSSSTVIGLNTRRYHGLLTAATKPPVGRLVLLSKLEETLVIDGRRYELSANQYPGVIHPQGFNYQTGFRLDPFPVFTYEVEGVRLEKSVFMIQGENTTVIQYQLLDPTNATLELRPLIAFRDYHSTTQAGCLYDVVNDADRDASIRPNQVIAISLANSMLSKERAASILRVVERELLTPRGLRTLSPADSNYIGRYEGGPSSRDGAYHQGTVWPWLMGPYISAYFKTFGDQAGRDFATQWIESFQNHLHEACLGQISEIFDGDAPHTPRGCVAQAWSVSELLRALIEDVNQPLNH